MSIVTVNDIPINIEGLSPDRTLLDFLRESMRLSGTKEGCASGDCGACTVVVGRSDENFSGQKEQVINYSAVNACITFVNTLAGCEIVTADNPKPDNLLRAVQRAMVEYHGSQCGFCTPGFVMSIYAMMRNVTSGAEANESATDQKALIDRYLGGNLCRCTGYRPIIDACHALLDNAQQIGASSATEKPPASDLATVAIDLPALSNQSFHCPESEFELRNIIVQHPDARFLAGGTDLSLEVTQQLKPVPSIIWLGRVAELQVLDVTEADCTIGAGVTLDRCRRALSDLFPDLGKMLLRFGSEQIRCQGTIGGNVGTASPIGDLPPFLLAMDATISIGGPEFSREMPLTDYFKDYRVTALGPLEYIRFFRLSNLEQYVKKSPNSFLKIYKISKRMDDDISSVCVTFAGTIVDGAISSIRIGFGGMAAIPLRVPKTEKALLGLTVAMVDIDSATADACRVLEAELQPISDARASAWYRRRVASNLIKRLFLELDSTRSSVRVDEYV